MKVCLVYPPPEKGMSGPWLNPYPPYGLFCLAAYLEKLNHEVFIIDCMVDRLSYKELKERITKIEPQVLGVCMLSSVHNSGIKCAQIAKEVSKDILTVLGGPHASGLDKEIIEYCPEVDVVVRKEGEIVMGNLLSALDRKSEIKGITYRDGHKVVRNDDEELLVNLDSLPFPAFHLAKMESYFRAADRYEFHLRSPSSILMTSRGCIGKCTYCASPFLWERLRMNSPKYTVENIKYQQRYFGVKDFKIFNDFFPVSRNWMEEFYEKIKKEKLDISYRCMGRVDLIDDNLLGLMKETGCYYIDFGIESGSQKILNRMKKNVSLEQIKKAVNLTEKHKINRGGFFMVGFEEESRRDLAQTLKMACSLHLDRACVSRTRLYPGTKMYQDSKIDPSFWFDGSAEKDVYNAPIFKSREFSDFELASICKHISHSAEKAHFWANLGLFFKTRKKISKFRILLGLIKQLLDGAYGYDKNLLVSQNGIKE